MRRVRAEGQHQTGHAAVIKGRINTMLAALAIDLLDAATSGFDVTGAKERGGDILALDADRVWNGNLHDVFSVETRLSLPLSRRINSGRAESAGSGSSIPR